MWWSSKRKQFIFFPLLMYIIPLPRTALVELRWVDCTSINYVHVQGFCLYQETCVLCCSQMQNILLSSLSSHVGSRYETRYFKKDNHLFNLKTSIIYYFQAIDLFKLWTWRGRMRITNMRERNMAQVWTTPNISSWPVFMSGICLHGNLFVRSTEIILTFW